MESTAFANWTKNRVIANIGTNHGSKPLPFQTWKKFKEAFVPELIYRAVKESYIPVEYCLDPFGGSGTTALACQFLNIHPSTIEINPFLADLIESKLITYDLDELENDILSVIFYASNDEIKPDEIPSLPRTFIEPGHKDKWLFNFEIAKRIFTYFKHINNLKNANNKRLLKVILGGILIDTSNVYVNGKGRKYRNNWKLKALSWTHVDEKFNSAIYNALDDIKTFQDQKTNEYSLVRGDSRHEIKNITNSDLIIFSPPYPNSFDYTDVYNVELWVLGYLVDSESNMNLRRNTLTSHIQVSRNYTMNYNISKTLNHTLNSLFNIRNDLWGKKIPEMVGTYFSEMYCILRDSHNILRSKGSTWMVVGDSLYNDVYVDSAKIFSEIAHNIGFKIETIDPFRSMRSSSQQGGKKELKESLIVLSKTN